MVRPPGDQTAGGGGIRGRRAAQRLWPRRSWDLSRAHGDREGSQPTIWGGASGTCRGGAGALLRHLCGTASETSSDRRHYGDGACGPVPAVIPLAARLAPPVQGRWVDAQDFGGFGLVAACAFQDVVDVLLLKIAQGRKRCEFAEAQSRNRSCWFQDCLYGGGV